MHSLIANHRLIIIVSSSGLKIWTLCVLLFFLAGFLTASHAEVVDTDKAGNAEIANELTNPLADLMIIPIQMNYDKDIGSQDEGWKFQMNIMPVIPIHLNDDWNLITRTILPVIYQEDVIAGSGSDFGIGDITQSFLLSPKEPGESGFLWGVGPVFRYPTATESLLGGKKWGAGPTALVLIRQGMFTIGALTNHLWSFAGDSDRQDINATLMQPFAAYTWPSAWSISMQSESVYDWETEQWAAPINLAVAKVVRFGRLPVRLQTSIGYWMESPEEGPEGIRLFFQVDFVLPKKR